MEEKKAPTPDRTLTELPFTEEMIRNAVQALAHQIHNRYRGNLFTLVGIAQGAIKLIEDLEAELILLGANPMVTWVGAKCYASDKPEEKVVIYDTPSLHHTQKRKVVVMDDILDRGTTLYGVCTHLMKVGGAKAIECGALVAKRQPPWVNPDYLGFHLPEDAPFVVGYGLDYNEKYRGYLDIHELTSAEKTWADSQKT